MKLLAYLRESPILSAIRLNRCSNDMVGWLEPWALKSSCATGTSIKFWETFKGEAFVDDIDSVARVSPLLEVMKQYTCAYV